MTRFFSVSVPVAVMTNVARSCLAAYCALICCDSLGSPVHCLWSALILTCSTKSDSVTGSGTGVGVGVQVGPMVGSGGSVGVGVGAPTVATTLCDGVGLSPDDETHPANTIQTIISMIIDVFKRCMSSLLKARLNNGGLGINRFYQYRS